MDQVAFSQVPKRRGSSSLSALYPSIHLIVFLGLFHHDPPWQRLHRFGLDTAPH